MIRWAPSLCIYMQSQLYTLKVYYGVLCSADMTSQPSLPIQPRPSGGTIRIKIKTARNSDDPFVNAHNHPSAKPELELHFPLSKMLALPTRLNQTTKASCFCCAVAPTHSPATDSSSCTDLSSMSSSSSSLYPQTIVATVYSNHAC